MELLIITRVWVKFVGGWGSKNILFKKFLNFCFFEEKTTFTSFEMFQEYMATHITYCGEQSITFSSKKNKNSKTF
jgi:hypothetical protein